MATQHVLRRYSFGPYELNLEGKELRKYGTRVPLQPQPLEALAYLLRRPGQVIAREELSAKLWPPEVHVDFEHSLNRIMNKLRLALCDSAERPKFIETLPGRGYRFLLTPTAYAEPSCTEGTEAETTTTRGALPLNCPYYIERTIDRDVRQAIAGRESIVLVKGARQTGKSSLLSRVIDHARGSGAQVIVTDFQRFSSSQIQSFDTLLPALAEDIADQTTIDFDFTKEWTPRRGVSVNFDRLVKRHVLADPRHTVWAMDEVDRLFGYPFATEMFGLIRSWHNERALRAGSPCERLTMVIAYATEAHLFISDLNQSPFNVGRRFFVADFSEDEVRELNRRYNEPLAPSEIATFYRSLGGHPYLTNGGLHGIATRQSTFAELACASESGDGLFGEHLRRMLLALRGDAELSSAVASLLNGRKDMSADAFYRLRTAGVIQGYDRQKAEMRCGLYREYLSRYML